MKHLARICFLILMTGCLLPQHAHATPADTTKPKKPTTLNDTWYLSGEPEYHYSIDTTIFNLEHYNPIQREGIEYTNAGNFGSAVFPTVYSVDRTTGFNAGYNQFDLYRYQKDSIRYYQVVRPYTELTMMIGLQKEQFFRGRFANQHKNVLYYGVDFTRRYSRGAYTNQRTNNNGFSLYGIYNSKNKHWNVNADLVFNSFKNQENGGVAIDIFDSSFFQKSLAPVVLRVAENNYRQTDFYLTTSYHAGKTYYERKDDTTRVKALMPVFKISYRFNIEKSKYSFRDDNPRADYYGAFYMPDSVFNDLIYLKTGNALQLEYHWRKLTSDSTYKEKNFAAYAEAGYDYYWVNQNLVRSSFGNLYVTGTVRNNFNAASKIIYRGTVKYYLQGWNQNDFFADALAGYNFGKFGMLTANFTYQMKEAPYIYERYMAHPLSWSYNLPKTIVMNVGGKYQNPNIGVTADANYYLIDNMPVYPGSAIPYFDTGQTRHLLVIHAGQRNAIAGVHFENDVWVSLPNEAGSFTDYFAFLYTKHSIYYERRVFKQALWFSTGFDVRLRYPNNQPYYEPLFGAFYPVAGKRTFVPQLDWFLNAKIRTVRIFMKVDNIISAIKQSGYYSLTGYPAADLSFRVGLTWRFFE